MLRWARRFEVDGISQAHSARLPTHVPPAAKSLIWEAKIEELLMSRPMLHSHQLQVYLYDNGSTDESRTLLRKYELSKFVHVRDWPYDGAQTEALNDCLCRFRHTTRCTGFRQGLVLCILCSQKTR